MRALNTSPITTGKAPVMEVVVEVEVVVVVGGVDGGGVEVVMVVVVGGVERGTQHIAHDDG